ncbi:MAG: hypothetical protein K0R15_728 [Clostridiales bacterium]|jgi:hypothetical protein|nr:hypothetical protein [Clostridiales bacterium]
MLDNVIEVVAIIIAAIIVMIFHELIKYLVYLIAEPKRKATDFKNILKVHKFIDVIGLIFFITTWMGFSKTSKYKISKLKTLTLIGISGFISMFMLFSLSIVLSKFVLMNQYIPEKGTAMYVVVMLLLNINTFVALFSLSMIITNLFPLATFDLSYIIAGRSQVAYVSILKADVILKILFTFLALSGLVSSIISYILNLLKL